MTATQVPRTYAKAFPVAETVTVEEFAVLVSECSGVTLLVRGRPRRHAFDVRLHSLVGYGFIGYDYCKRTGYGDHDVAYLDRTVFDFYQVGRLVKVA